VARTFFLDAVQPDVADAFEEALDVCRDLGAEVVDVNWKGAARARAAAMIVNRVEMAAIHARDVATNPEGYGAELRERLAMAAQVSATSYLRAQQTRLASRQEMAALFAEYRLDALLAPTLPSTAVRSDDQFSDYPGGYREAVGWAHTRLTQPFNATGQPVLVLPCGFDREGLPISLSIAGRPDDELTVCRIGLAYQQSTDWHKRRPPVLSR
jgi:aspartyl-tRNA(Asn)/glutamyl-tRNA(Gln) amidotransferase subunit A